jgi:serralysin
MFFKAELSELNIFNINRNPNSNPSPSPAPTPSPNPNFVQAQGNTIFLNYSQNPANILTAAQTDILVKNGVSIALAEAQAVFNTDPTFSALFTNSAAVGGNGQFTSSADSQTKVLASFTVGANQTFSFNFSADLALKAKEIENPNVEYNFAQSKATFVVLDTTNPNKPVVLDYFGIEGDLISSKKTSDLKFSSSRNVTITSRNKTTDIDGNNGTDFLNGSAIGTYRQKFSRNTNITIVEINTSSVELAGDTLIGNLGKDFIYGTIWNDNLKGTNGADKLYASLGNDSLYGYQGDDLLYGGDDNDILVGGSDDDILVGGDGNDKFVFNSSDSLFRNDFDVIKDFEVGVDQIVLQGWGFWNTDILLKLGKITDTNDGALLKLDVLFNKETILIAGVNSSQLNSQSIVFS